jgi:photosystem II stability/assembly factor-like uncharacterized protein
MIDKEPLEPRLHRYLEECDAERPPSGLEHRIIRIIRDQPRRRPVPAVPGQIVAAAAIAIVAIGLAAGIAYLRGHATANNGPAPGEKPALSIGTQGGGDWIVVRGIDYGTPRRLPGPAHNTLYHTADGGQTWQDRLHFDGIYDGMSWASDGKTGVVWTFDMTRPCGPTAQACNILPSRLYTVYSTTDGGLHWKAGPEQTFGEFGIVYFRGLSGWILSRQDYAQGQTPTVPELFHTTDGGASWTKVSSLPDLNGMQLSGGIWGSVAGVGQTNLVFSDEQHGWLATGLEGSGSNSGLLETTDGGKSWHSVTIQPPAAFASQQVVLGYPILLKNGHALLPVFFGKRTGPNDFSISHRYIYSSSDGGSTWNNPLPLRAQGIEPTGDEWQNFYLDGNNWWFTAINQRSSGEPVPQASPAVARSMDGGKTWKVFTDKNAPIILQMTFTDPNNGWAFAIAGPNDTTNVLLRTTDGGAHWHQVQIP